MNFERKIETIDQAKGFIAGLMEQDRDYHFDDDPKEVIDYSTGERAFTDKEAEQLVKRIDEMYALEWGEYECPIGYLLHLREEAGE